MAKRDGREDRDLPGAKFHQSGVAGDHVQDNQLPGQHGRGARRDDGCRTATRHRHEHGGHPHPRRDRDRRVGMGSPGCPGNGRSLTRTRRRTLDRPAEGKPLRSLTAGAGASRNRPVGNRRFQWPWSGRCLFPSRGRHLHVTTAASQSDQREGASTRTLARCTNRRAILVRTADWRLLRTPRVQRHECRGHRRYGLGIASHHPELRLPPDGRPHRRRRVWPGHPRVAVREIRLRRTNRVTRPGFGGAGDPPDLSAEHRSEHENSIAGGSNVDPAYPPIGAGGIRRPSTAASQPTPDGLHDDAGPHLRDRGEIHRHPRVHRGDHRTSHLVPTMAS